MNPDEHSAGSSQLKPAECQHSLRPVEVPLDSCIIRPNWSDSGHASPRQHSCGHWKNSTGLLPSSHPAMNRPGGSGLMRSGDPTQTFEDLQASSQNANYTLAYPKNSLPEYALQSRRYQMRSGTNDPQRQYTSTQFQKQMLPRPARYESIQREQALIPEKTELEVFDADESGRVGYSDKQSIAEDSAELWYNDGNRNLSHETLWSRKRSIQSRYQKQRVPYYMPKCCSEPNCDMNVAPTVHDGKHSQPAKYAYKRLKTNMTDRTSEAAANRAQNYSLYDLEAEGYQIPRPQEVHLETSSPFTHFQPAYTNGQEDKCTVSSSSRQSSRPLAIRTLPEKKYSVRIQDTPSEDLFEYTAKERQYQEDSSHFSETFCPKFPVNYSQSNGVTLRRTRQEFEHFNYLSGSHSRQSPSSSGTPTQGLKV
jgi:hypothetical protein